MVRTRSALAGLDDVSEAPEDVRSAVVNDLPHRLGYRGSYASEIDFFDLTPRGRAPAGEGVCLSLVDDRHASSDGHHFAAEAIQGSLAPDSNRATSPEHR